MGKLTAHPNKYSCIVTVTLALTMGMLIT